MKESMPEDLPKKINYQSYFTFIFIAVVTFALFGTPKDTKTIINNVPESKIAKYLEYNPLIPIFYNASGRVVSGPIKILNVDITPSTSTGYVYTLPSGIVYTDATSMNIQLTCISNTSTITSVYAASEKSHTLTTVTINITAANSQTLSILGVNVVGLLFPTTLTGLTIHLHIEGV